MPLIDKIAELLKSNDAVALHVTLGIPYEPVLRLHVKEQAVEFHNSAVTLWVVQEQTLRNVGLVTSQIPAKQRVQSPFAITIVPVERVAHHAEPARIWQQFVNGMFEDPLVHVGSKMPRWRKRWL